MDVSELPQLIAGRYRPVRKIGEGNMGFIFEVEHERTGERLALKLMRTHAFAGATLLDRFKREARASARIKSDHVVRVTDADAAPELDGALFLVMELLEGTDLEKAAGGIPQSPAVVVEWLRQAALGLDKAHQLGIVHRDLKPENLFLTRNERGEPRIKILDFGIAKTLEDAPGTTQSGQLLGTPLFMSPEQARTTDEVGPSADRFALGLIAYKLLSGVDYWEPAPNVAGVIAQILYHPMAAPSERGVEFGPDFDAWFARACNRDPSARFSSATELVEALGRSLGMRVSQTSFPAVTYGRIVTADGMVRSSLLSMGGHTASLAPTLSSASRDVAGVARAPRRGARWAAFVAAAVAVAGMLAWFARLAVSPEPQGAQSAVAVAPNAPVMAAALPVLAVPSVPSVPSSAALPAIPSAAPAAVAVAQPSAAPVPVVSASASGEEPPRKGPAGVARGPRVAAPKHPPVLAPKKLAPAVHVEDDPLADQK